MGSQFGLIESRERGEWEETLLVSPISEDLCTYNGYGGPSPRNSVLSTAVAHEPFEAIQSLEYVRTDHPNHSLTDTSGSPGKLGQMFHVKTPFDDYMIQTSISQVDELRGLVHIINMEWIRRLDMTPVLQVDRSVCDVPLLFDTGIQTLQGCYVHTYPNTFKEIFALMHVVCAIIYSLHGNDPSYEWGDFFQELLQWRHVLQGSDAWLLMAFINLFWSPGAPSISPLLNKANLANLDSIQLPTRTPSPHMNAHHGWSLKTQDVIGYPARTFPLPGPQRVHVETPLRNGQILSKCSEFLNGMP